MKKRIFITVTSLLVLIVGLAGIKGLQFGTMIAMGESFSPPPATVTAALVRKEIWETSFSTIGTLDAIKGVQVSAELPGKIVEIHLVAGAKVKAGALLAQQDTSSEEALLRAANAAAKLTHISLNRNQELLSKKMIPQAEYDASVAQHEQAIAQAENIKSNIAKKTLRAPFSGRLGTHRIDIGQNLKEGESIVSLQALDRAFVNFQLPQIALNHLKSGLRIKVSADTLPLNEMIEGNITAIEPEVDAGTRNVNLQAIIPNPGERLLPGMFVNVSVILPAQNEVLIIPTMAVLYAPYGDSVFVVDTHKSEKNGADEKVLRQQFVRLGEARGDFVEVVSGLNENENIVTAGVFKLRNGQAVIIDNTLQPEFKLNPVPADS